MSEFGTTIAPAGSAMSAPAASMENSTGFSSRNLGMFKNIPSTDQGMISLDHGTEKVSEFARSESFEKNIQESQPLFDITNPVREEPMESFGETNSLQQDKKIDSET